MFEIFSRYENKIHPDELNNQLKKFGHSQLASNIKKHGLTSWITDNIKKKECCLYVQSDREGICKCGYLKIHHADDSVKSESYQGQRWDQYRHVREVPTDAFGDISFGGQGKKTGKYVRVSSDTKAELLYQLLTEQWKLPPPNLLISVTGGAKNFYMKPHLKTLFHRGLIKVAQTTGAWIITGGTHTGVMKHVGRAIRDYILSSTSMEGQIVAIGVATWGTIHNRNSLVNPAGCFQANYSLEVQSQGPLSCLDNNHSHFLLVDNGTNGLYGVEIELRSRLERLISQQPLGNKESGVTIPVVCVVLEGGPGFPVSKVTLSLIRQLMKRFFSQEYCSFTELKIIEWTKKIQDIISLPQLLTVFRISEDHNGDVDVAILQALLKANRSSDSEGRESWERQLELAVAWNRVDIASSDIFTEESQWKSCDLHPAMVSALLANKPEFVRLFLENGVCLEEFLQEESTLCHLYSQLPTTCFFLRCLAKRIQTETGAAHKNISLQLVSDEVRHLLGSFTQPLYPLPGIGASYFKKDVSVDIRSKGELESKVLTDRGPESGQSPPRDPGRDLFLWAILQNNKDLAEIAWEQCQDCISAALAASKILKKLAEEDEEDEEAVEMRGLADHYERHAIGVFSECHRGDEERARRMLTRSSTSWGHTTSLRLALEADDKSFIAHSGVQALLTQIWCGELAVDNPLWRVMLCMAFFPLIYTGFLRFRLDDCIQKETQRSEELITMASVTGCSAKTRRKTSRHTRNMISSGLKPLNCAMRLASLFTSPQVKFFWNILSYFGFLLLFSVVLMIDFQATPSWMEYLLYVWLISLVCEEIRQLFHDPDGFAFRKKAEMYINNLWNILDVLSILLFTIGLVFRLTPSLWYAGKVILCIDFIVFCLRLMAIFTISKTLGPKIIIVKRMILDMFFFMFLLSIWVVAYGVATQGILVDNEDRLNWLIRGAVYKPYLIIFGNMPSDIDSTQFDITACSVNGTDPLQPKCPILNEDQMPIFPEWLTIILLCVYLLLANILLLNLLIAIFNYTFQQVQDNTDTIWKFQRPPPSYQNFKEQLSMVEEEELLSWESFMRDNYLLSTRLQLSQGIQQQIKETADKVETMTQLLRGENYQAGSVAIAKRLTRLEDQVFQSAEALQWIMDALKAQGHHSKQDALQLALPSKLSPDDPGEPKTKEEERKETCYHVNARRLVYPGSNIPRFPVPEEKVPWEVEFTLYRPPVLNGEGQEQTNSLNRNPAGRTGMMGRGALKSLGSNHIMDLVLTCWRDSKCSALEFLSVWDKGDGLWVLPQCPVQSDEPLSDSLRSIVGRKMYDMVEAKLVKGAKVYEGYVDDIRNTDDAWVETTVLNIHLDKKDQADINHMVGSIIGCEQLVKWVDVSTRDQMCSYQKDSVRQVAKLNLSA
ncbi:hypothetical protein UPYG_G00160580 [Umbra pygmaea]|uniref:Transient receptor potential cation channel subfamily M member 2 n=1 Tax=Umbra pygmaea TaxID=75934 RepID=A0ABD0XF55_UMBPY